MSRVRVSVGAGEVACHSRGSQMGPLAVSRHTSRPALHGTLLLAHVSSADRHASGHRRTDPLPAARPAGPIHSTRRQQLPSWFVFMCHACWCKKLDEAAGELTTNFFDRRPRSLHGWQHSSTAERSRIDSVGIFSVDSADGKPPTVCATGITYSKLKGVFVRTIQLVLNGFQTCFEIRYHQKERKLHVSNKNPLNDRAQSSQNISGS